MLLTEITTRLLFKITDKKIDIYKNFYFERMPPILMSDKLLGRKLIPNVSENACTSDFQVVYTTNSYGLREKEIEDTNKFKILFLGDSQTFGEGVPYGKRFSDIIEQEISGVYTINAGVPSYGIHQMYFWLREYGIRLKPDIIICSIIFMNLQRAIYKKIGHEPHLIIKRREAPKENKEDSKLNYFATPILIKLDKFLIQRSYFYAVAKVKIKILQMRKYLKERDRNVWEEIRLEREAKGYKVTTDEHRKIMEEESEEIFRSFKDMLKETSSRFLVMYIDIRPMPRWLKYFLRDENIEFLDLSAVLRKAGNIKFEIDPHYNSTGHRIIANFLKGYLLETIKEKNGVRFIFEK